MELQVLRFNSNTHNTLGILFDVTDRALLLSKRKDTLAFTLEDEYRNEKKFGETRIPAGKYKVILRKHGGFHNRYSERFSWHEGMLEIENIPNFTDVLIHIGNDDEDTAGCLLVGASATLNSKDFIGQSSQAYEKVYKHILSALKDNKEVTIEYIDYDFS